MPGSFEGLPPSSGHYAPPLKRAFYDAFPLGDKLEAEGIPFAELQAGQTYHYTSREYRYVISILGYGQLDDEELPLVRAEVLTLEDESKGDTTGLLFGLSLDGIGSLPIRYLPADGDTFRTLVFSVLSDDGRSRYLEVLMEQDLPQYS